jgi:peptidoglycan/LPS O-acetylase OafA/YrhL
MGVLLLAVLGVVRSEPVLLAGTAVAGWGFIVALLGFASVVIKRNAGSLAYLRESAFPIYILHQPAIVLLGAIVVELPLGIAGKFVVLLAGSVLATMLAYHFIVRPVPVLRLVHGMKPKRRSRAPVAPRVALARG